MNVNIPLNGFGLAYGARMPNEHIENKDWFDDSGNFFETLEKYRSIVLSGEPGAGKSHIVQDVYNEGLIRNYGCAIISCHINGGNKKGRTQTYQLIEDLRAEGKNALIIFDNFDYAVYTGGSKRRRTHRQTADFCEFITSAALECADSGCLVLATAHTEEWRDNHSHADRQVREKYSDTVARLGGYTDFHGKLTEENAKRLLINRGIDPDIACQISKELSAIDQLIFRQVFHIDANIVQTHGIKYATIKVDELKSLKLFGGA